MTAQLSLKGEILDKKEDLSIGPDYYVWRTFILQYNKSHVIDENQEQKHGKEIGNYQMKKPKSIW